MKGPQTKPTVKLIGHDGNAFSIMGCVKKALMQAGADKEYIDKYLKESTVAEVLDIWLADAERFSTVVVDFNHALKAEDAMVLSDPYDFRRKDKGRILNIKNLPGNRRLQISMG